MCVHVYAFHVVTCLVHCTVGIAALLSVFTAPLFIAPPKDLTSVGVGMASIHVTMYPGVGTYCRVDRVPSVVLLVNRRPTHYQGHLSANKLKDFVGSALSAYVSEVSLQCIYICTNTCLHVYMYVCTCTVAR